MKTKTFNVIYQGARYTFYPVYGQDTSVERIRLKASVSTDHAFHDVSLEFTAGVPDNRLSIEMGRAYTPQQEKYVRDLFTYRFPEAQAKSKEWLAAHNLNSTHGDRYILETDSEGKASSFRFEKL